MERNASGHCKLCDRVRSAKPMSEVIVRKPCIQCGAVDRNRRGDCKPCARKASAEWRASSANVQGLPCKNCGEANRDRHGNCKPCAKVRGREWARQHKDVVNPRNRLNKYGLTKDQLDQMVLAQNGLCIICQNPLPKKYHIDHDHADGFVRGLLCFNCNFGLGQFRENADSLRRAAEYVEQFSLRHLKSVG